MSLSELIARRVIFNMSVALVLMEASSGRIASLLRPFVPWS